ncbi:nucleoside recognition domain-containing protein [Bacillus fonticola]|uniref:nucleoside recognition domain-containing protein n=1 Tax=Bacillus fonticola TaxID=2728853 RepID=UPI001476166D|nr:nucleoside recognition domain-containing protein [Bacillus fonticola]
MKASIGKGLKVGLKTTWTLGKVIFPITLIVTLLQYTPVFPWLMEMMAPLMSVLGLPGEASIPLVLGNLLNLYAGIGAILTLDLTVKEVFTLAVMLSFSHNLLIETGVALKTGVKLWIILVTRIGLAIVAAVVINLIWSGGSERAQYGFVSQSEEVIEGWGAIVLEAIWSATVGILQLAIIVIPLMVAIQVIKDRGGLTVFSRWMAPVTRALGMQPNTSTTMAAGLVFGLAYGAGVMIQAVKEDGVSKKDATLAFIFLVACHAVVEDTLIFIPLGIPVWPLLLIRLGVAVILTLVVATIWNRRQKRSNLYEQQKHQHHSV